MSYDEYVNSKGKKFIGYLSSERKGVFPYILVIPED